MSLFEMAPAVAEHHSAPAEHLSRRRMIGTAAGAGVGIGLMGLVGLPGARVDAATTPTGQVYLLVNQHRAAAGQATGTAVMKAWMNSSSHRANILSSNFIQMGISYVRGSNGVLYWTMTLARGVR
jgi:hypothetical protein